MSVGVLERPVAGPAHESTTGGVSARRAMLRWSWRLFRREWRQQLLILLLIVVAVAAVVVGAAVAVNTPPPPNAGFGTAQDQATYSPPDPQLVAQLFTELDDERFARREHAADELARLGDSAEPALLRLLEQAETSPEARRRQLADDLQCGPALRRDCLSARHP